MQFLTLETDRSVSRVVAQAQTHLVFDSGLSDNITKSLLRILLPILVYSAILGILFANTLLTDGNLLISKVIDPKFYFKVYA